VIQTLYLDMDGVIADFDSYWSTLDTTIDDDRRFWHAVYDFKIFEQLSLMPNAEKLLKFLRKLKNTRVEILSATGSTDARQSNLAMAQKLNWLEENRIFFKANFVAHAEQKCDFAYINTLLIDDREKAITPFKVFGGVGILHTDVDTTIEKIRKYVS
jgi:5'(3')-deoxyribonucleotidase